MKWMVCAYPLILLWTACSPEELLPQAAPCDQQFVPEALIPGSDCDNPCQYGYAGEVDLPFQKAVINCRSDYEGIRIYLDSTSLFGPGRVPLKAFALELRTASRGSLDAFCRHDIQWGSEDWPGLSYELFFQSDPDAGMYWLYIIPEPGFWAGFRSGRFRFRFSIRNPLYFP
jgi:hypothetical protein